MGAERRPILNSGDIWGRCMPEASPRVGAGNVWTSDESLVSGTARVKAAHHIKSSVTEQQVVHPKSRLPIPSRRSTGRRWPSARGPLAGQLGASGRSGSVPSCPSSSIGSRAMVIYQRLNPLRLRRELDAELDRLSALAAPDPYRQSHTETATPPCSRLYGVLRRRLR